MYVSFDDGDDWQSLRLNMPAHVDPRPGRSRTTTWSSARTAASSGFSTTSRRCGSSTPDAGSEPRHLFAPPRRTARAAGTRTPTRRCRPTSRPGRTRRTARSSTTRCATAAPAGDAGDPRRRAARVVRRVSQRRHGRAARRRAQRPRLLDRSAPRSLSGAARPASLRVGPPRCAARRAASFAYPIAAILGDTPREPRGPGRCRAPTPCASPWTDAR